MIQKPEEKVNGGVLVRSTATDCKVNRQIQCNHPNIEEYEIQIGDEWTCGNCEQPWRASLDKMAAPRVAVYWRRCKTKKTTDKIPAKPGPG